MVVEEDGHERPGGQTPGNGNGSNVGKKRRATGSRSRSGCLTCRARHVRCDEGRPSCTNCITGARICDYPAPAIPLRDRRVLEQGKGMLPGQHAPWSAKGSKAAEALSASAMPIWNVKLQPSATFDPFEALPIKMPFKSKELFHYFHRAGEIFDVIPKSKEEDCVALAALDEHSLRNTMLIASLHYTWNTGNASAFGSAMLFHKIESIRSITTWLRSPLPTTATLCVRQIVTLCMSEACLGDIPAAQTHFDGLVTFLGVQECQYSSSLDFYANDDTDIELSNRYLLMTHHFIHFLKTRFLDFVLWLHHGVPHTPSTAAAAFALMHAWHESEPGGLNTRLRALRLFPSFFAPPPAGRKAVPVDSANIIAALRDTTSAIDDAVRKRAVDGRTYIDREPLWNGGGPTRLFLGMVDCHARSFGADPPTGQMGLDGKGFGKFRFRSMWCGVAGCAGLYLQHTLCITWRGGEAVDRRLLRRMVSVLREDVRRTEGCLRSTTAVEEDQDEDVLTERAFWFWKVWLGAVSLAKAKSNGPWTASDFTPCSVRDGKAPAGAGEEWERELPIAAPPRPDGSDPIKKDLEELKVWYEERVREWSEVAGVKDWESAKRELRRVVWPEAMPRGMDRKLRRLWERVVAGVDGVEDVTCCGQFCPT